MSAPNVTAAATAVREALAILQRASSDWRQGDPRQPGPIHWTAALPAAREALSRALQALESEPDNDAQTGMAWWNGLTVTQRRNWLEIAHSAIPADAWRAFQAGRVVP